MTPDELAAARSIAALLDAHPDAVALYINRVDMAAVLLAAHRATPLPEEKRPYFWLGGEAA